MDVLRSLLVSVLLTPIPAATTAAEGTDALVRLFATCVGRLSAEVEFRWLMREPSDDVAAEHTATLQILDALDPGSSVEVLAWRVEAKSAQRALLARTTFNADAADRAWAAERSAEELTRCRSLLLPSSDAAPGV